MRHIIGAFSLSFLLIGLGGCSYVFYPRAGDYAAQAKGPTAVETMINLTNMMEASEPKPKAAKVQTLRSTITIISSTPV